MIDPTLQPLKIHIEGCCSWRQKFWLLRQNDLCKALPAASSPTPRSAPANNWDVSQHQKQLENTLGFPGTSKSDLKHPPDKYLHHIFTSVGHGIAYNCEDLLSAGVAVNAALYGRRGVDSTSSDVVSSLTTCPIFHHHPACQRSRYRWDPNATDPKGIMEDNK